MKNEWPIRKNDLMAQGDGEKNELIDTVTKKYDVGWRLELSTFQ